MQWIYAGTLFWSAALLFLVQPLAGKLLLPWLGGTPAVWNTCLVFFQSLLLLGYAYAHSSTRYWGAYRQSRWHLGILLLTGCWLLGSIAWWQTPLPFFPEWLPVEQEFPTGAVVAILALAFGPAFVVLSANGPLLSLWYGHSTTRDPYWLYAASNAGSFAGLLAYPLWWEPTYSLSQQGWLWAAGVGIYLILATLCAAGVPRRAPRVESLEEGTAATSGALPPEPALAACPEPQSVASPVEVSARGSAELAEEPRAVSVVSRWYWLGWAALTSLWLNATSTHLTTDITPTPILWVIPLALYLLTFVGVFAHWTEGWQRVVQRMTTMALLFLAFMLMVRATEPWSIVLGLPLIALTLVCLVGHGALALSRPAADRVTEFYLCVSAGSVAGSLTSAFLAPWLFQRLGNLEYPLAIVITAYAGLAYSNRWSRGGQRSRPQNLSLRWGGVLSIAVLGAFTAAALWAKEHPALAERWGLLTQGAAAIPSTLMTSCCLGIPIIVLFTWSKQPGKFAGGLAILFLVAAYDPGPNGQALHVQRNFFGTLRVTLSPDQKYIRLFHGTTQHGQQAVDPLRRSIPLMYYHPTGPAGRTLERLPPAARQSIGVVGLGCGALAGYIRPGEKWTFFEIDPGVIRLAQDSRFFHYLADAQGDWQMIPGDARRRLAEVPDFSLSVLVLDAFSSDSIPLHLLTQEAWDLYAKKLTPDGVLLCHVSNRYWDLPPLLARMAAKHNWVAYVDHDEAKDEEILAGKSTSSWLLVGGSGARDVVKRDRRWQRESVSEGPIWTDDFANIWSAWRRAD